MFNHFRREWQGQMPFGPRKGDGSGETQGRYRGVPIAARHVRPPRAPRNEYLANLLRGAPCGIPLHRFVAYLLREAEQFQCPVTDVDKAGCLRFLGISRLFQIPHRIDHPAGKGNAQKQELHMLMND